MKDMEKTMLEARGQFEALLAYLDTAAAQAVVEASGGHVVTLEGSALRYNTRDGLLNPQFLVFGDEKTDWPGLMA